MVFGTIDGGSIPSGGTFMFKVFLTVLIWLFIFPKTVSALYDPLKTDNNRFGIHIADSVDLEEAAKLVNSQGGDWGYVTFVIRKDDRDVRHWQKVFDRARKLHLIPIVRIATRLENDNWEKPSVDEIDGWVSFLSSLNWVIENRYVIIGNEPNHAKEWGGTIEPKEYGEYYLAFAKKLKSANPDFFLLSAGLDASAPNSKETMDEVKFLNLMLESNPDFYNYLDGWNSHSYPNPAFSGSEYAAGRGTIKTYQWELNLLKNLGLKKDLPVFITETGWMHSMDTPNRKILSPSLLGNKFAYAFNYAWNDNRVVAVTPFIFKYLESPFDNFSWLKKDGGYYPFYDQVLDLKKPKGSPQQYTSGRILKLYVQPILLNSNTFTGIAVIENTGQTIWDGNTFNLKTADGEIKILSFSHSELTPENTGILIFRGETKSQTGLYSDQIILLKDGEVTARSGYFTIIKLF